jgi:hypothetical protein
LILSATDNVDHLIKLINLGVNYFIPKPYDLDLLCTVVIKTFEKELTSELLNTIQVCKDKTEKEHSKEAILEKDVKTASQLYQFLLQNSSKMKIDSKYNSIVIDSNLLIKSINDLLLYSINIENYFGHSELESLLSIIARKFLDIHYKLIEFNSIIMENISDIFLDYHEFFISFSDTDALDPKQLEELLHVKFITSGVKKFVNNIFIEPSDKTLMTLMANLESILEKMEKSIYG